MDDSGQALLLLPMQGRPKLIIINQIMINDSTHLFLLFLLLLTIVFFLTNKQKARKEKKKKNDN